MKFLTKTECEAYVKRLGPLRDIVARQSPERFKKRADFLYQSRLLNGPQVAGELVAYHGGFASSLLWTHSLIWGDGTEDPEASRDWLGYGLWRKDHGARAGLFDLPGQIFDADEGDELAKGIEWTIYTGSDALIVARPMRTIIHLSHDDFISIQSRGNPVAAHAFEELGLKRWRQ